MQPISVSSTQQSTLSLSTQSTLEIWCHGGCRTGDQGMADGTDGKGGVRPSCNQLQPAATSHGNSMGMCPGVSSWKSSGDRGGGTVAASLQCTTQ